MFLIRKIVLAAFFVVTSSIAAQEKGRVLLVQTVFWMGGDCVHTVELLRKLQENGYYADILVTKESPLHKFLKNNNISCYTTPHEQTSTNASISKAVAKTIVDICKKNKLSIVHCNNRFQTASLMLAAKEVPIKTVFTYHHPYAFPQQQLSGIDGFMTVNNSVLGRIASSNRKTNDGIKQIEYIPPLFNAEKFLNYKASALDRQSFFKKNFGISVGNKPLIVVVANMYKNLKHKNYPLLLEALRLLKFRHRQPFHLVAAGDGLSMEQTKQIAAQKGLMDSVSFVGFTEKIPDLLSYADVVVLASSFEAFGISLLEAGLMKKATIAARDTGAQQIIINEKTGLLFARDNATDLASKIEKVITNKSLAQELGLAAYDHVTKNFLSDVTFSKIEKFYQKILTD